ncbi:MAG TPA: hypothetical protein VK644_13970 [Chitinophagaceae bacterium]|nr:hypothetical protein [Chitinophagaceae bacterium]
MKKKYGIGLLAIIVAVSAAAFTIPSQAPEKKAPLGPFYFQFSGTHSHESNIANWNEITQSQYDNGACTGLNQKGCQLKTDQKDMTGTHPQVVPVDAFDIPQVSGSVKEVKNTTL